MVPFSNPISTSAHKCTPWIGFIKPSAGRQESPGNSYLVILNFDLLGHSCVTFLPILYTLELQPVAGHLYVFQVRTLRAGKLNEKILKLFIATGKEEILSLIGAFNIQCVLTPVLPTRCSEKF
ncbi:hypothetical protein KY289_020767 [Solanum tuberosum]|nr:hypothetical protein KY289_020767 [Solanum tuberosum]